MTVKFPDNFIWGTATSAHQTEGNNKNTDWWRWEHSKNSFVEPSNEACDSYNRYEEDFDLCRKLNNNGVRISIEWARIQPKENEFSTREINHYKKVLECAKSKGLKTFVTLHHFSNPLWFSRKKGWLNPKSPVYFAKYAKRCAHEFGNLIDVYLTINEPQVYALQSYLRGQWPPNCKNLLYSLTVQLNMMRAHNKASINIKKAGNYAVGIVKNIVWHEPARRNNIIDKAACKVMNFLVSDFFLFPINAFTDVIGVNYYFTNRMIGLKRKNKDDVLSDIGWWVNPKGIKNVLLMVKKYNKPVFITETGVSDSSDKLRSWFIKETLKYCHQALSKGVLLYGYFYWSLIDNYEWHRGFTPRFGLVEIDRDNNLKRIPRPSFYMYSEICKNGKLNE